MPPRPGPSQKKKLYTNKTLESNSKAPPKRETDITSKPQDAPNSILSPDTKPETVRYIGKKVLPGKPKLFERKEEEETVLEIGEDDDGEIEAYEDEEEDEEEEEVVEEVVEDEEEEEVEEVEEETEVHEVPEPVNARRKQKEYEVFVGGLDRDAVEEDVEKAFKGVGVVVEVRLAKNVHSQRNKGFAFVRFATVEQAKRAVTQIKSIKVKGKVCGILRNNDNETLHLRNICTSWTKDKLIQKLKAFDLVNLEEVHLMDDPNDKGKNRGYAFLDFSTHMDALAACTKLQKRDIFFGTNVRAEVAFSKSGVEPDEEVMAQVKSVFLDGLPASWEESNVHELFKKYGEIENVQLARNMPTAKRKDFGFICFRNREAALSCIDDVNGKWIGVGTDKVILKATLKKPLLKRAQVMGGRRGSYSAHGERGRHSHGIGRSYFSRTIKTNELLGSDRFDRFSSLGKYSVKGDKLNMESPPVERYADRLRRKLIRREPAPVFQNSRRDPYFESSASGRQAMDGYREFSTSYSHLPSRRLYDDDGYGFQYEYYEDGPSAAYDYPAYSRSKRPYSPIDDDLVASSSLTRRARIRPSLEMAAYPSQVSDEYSEVLMDDYHDYERMGHSSRHYGHRYLSGSGASTSFY